MERSLVACEYVIWDVIIVNSLPRYFVPVHPLAFFVGTESGLNNVKAISRNVLTVDFLVEQHAKLVY